MKALLCLLWLVVLPLARVPQQDETLAVARAYRNEILIGRDLDACLDLCAEDVRWIDPTTAIWGMPLAQGVSGNEVMRTTMKGFGITEARFDLSHEFSAGPFACLFGEFSTKNPRGGMDKLPFLTVLQVKEGKITKRTDYGDYDQLFPAEQRTREKDIDPIVALSTEYLTAYADSDFETLRALLAPDAVFQDPTGVAIGAGQALRGGETIAASLEATFAGIEEFAIDVDTRFFFQDHAVFVGTCGYTLPGRSVGLKRETARFEHELIIVLQVVDEQVVSHLDYADYDSYRAQLEAMRVESEE